jgi:drug/metabolite transporter (DMT)-like permease
MGLSLATILSIRFTGAALILAAFQIIVRRKSIFPGTKLVLRLFLLGAFVYAFQSMSFFMAMERIPASLGSLLLYAYPVMVALLSWVTSRHPPTPRQWLAMLLALSGVALTANLSNFFAVGSTSVDQMGVILALMAAFGYAVYIVFSEPLLAQAGTLVSTLWISIGSAVSFTIGGLLGGTLSLDLPPLGPLLLLVMMLFSTILPLGTLLAGIARVGPTTASLLSTLEPVFTILLAWLVLAELLSPIQAAGGALVLLSVVILNLPSRKRHTERLPESDM